VTRLLRLHATSRQLPYALAYLVGTAAVLRVVEPWTHGASELSRLLPLLLTVAAAGIVATSSGSPFGEVERTGCRLPLLRLIHLGTLLIIAAAVLVAARPTDAAVLVRNLAGLTGLALATASVLGGPLGWTAPLAYTVLCGGAIDLRDETVWTWPTLPAPDPTAAVLAVVVFGGGLAAAVVNGGRDQPPRMA
jgi:hypothetical protein